MDSAVFQTTHGSDFDCKSRSANPFKVPWLDVQEETIGGQDHLDRLPSSFDKE
jgi:hypothetical protein